MKKKIGQALSGLGVIGVLYYGYQYFNNSESFEALGADIAISTGDYVPVLISAVVLLVGVVLTRFK